MSCLFLFLSPELLAHETQFLFPTFNYSKLLTAV